jgi:hypothetical protein
MDRSPEQSSEILLARVNHEMERISEAQHRLARRKALLQEQATRLRLGASATEVRLTLQALDGDRDGRTRTVTSWSRDHHSMERRQRYGAGLL